MSGTILITIDVEDWFQVENFKSLIPFSSWPSRELRVEKNTRQLLDILGHRRATFFILGWIAERLPGLVRDIHDQGHEVASHGYHHNLCNQQSVKELEKDLADSKKRLEDIIGASVVGYRAPSFSINEDVLKVIESCGYRYDSSFNSFAMHDRYGYFRLIPFPIFRMGIRQIMESDGTYLFYMHPWELDPGQPRVNDAPPSYKFRHYTNLKRVRSKLSGLFKAFRRSEFVTCRDYLAGC